MKISIKTTVAGIPRSIFSRFTEDLFRALAPPFPSVRVIQFDGCYVGDTVSVELNFLFFRTMWTSIIEEQGSHEHEIYFTDRGVLLPFFLSAWHHTHIIRTLDAEHSAIIDTITFEAHHPILTFIISPFIIMQFLYRKPVYKRYFR